jgi:hypothetical protein
MDGDDGREVVLPGEDDVVESDLLGSSAALRCTASARMVDQNAPHRDGRGTEDILSAAPVDAM